MSSATHGIVVVVTFGRRYTYDSNGDRELIYNVAGRDAVIPRSPASGKPLVFYDRHGNPRMESPADEVIGCKVGHHEIALAGIEPRMDT